MPGPTQLIDMLFKPLGQILKEKYGDKTV